MKQSFLRPYGFWRAKRQRLLRHVAIYSEICWACNMKYSDALCQKRPRRAPGHRLSSSGCCCEVSWSEGKLRGAVMRLGTCWLSLLCSRESSQSFAGSNPVIPAWCSFYRIYLCSCCTFNNLNMTHNIYLNLQTFTPYCRNYPFQIALEKEFRDFWNILPASVYESSCFLPYEKYDRIL